MYSYFGMYPIPNKLYYNLNFQNVKQKSREMHVAFLCFFIQDQKTYRGVQDQTIRLPT